MTKDEALRIALEALEKISMGEDPRWADEAIIAIKEALETKDEPVAWCDPKEIWQLKNGRGYFIVMPEKNHVYSKPLYTTPQRTWVGLTDEDMGFLFPHGKSVWVQEIVKIIENKLKEKNT